MTYLRRAALLALVLLLASLPEPAVAKQDVTVQLFYSGAWQTITSDAYARTDIEITRGRGDEASHTRPVTATLTLDNRDGDYSPSNPESPLYGLVGRNTPLRIAVDSTIRFVGEVSSWTPRESVDGNDAWVEVVAAGLTRRLEQGADPLRDTVYRHVEHTSDPDLVGYWPLDDPTGADSGRSAIADVPPLRSINRTEAPLYGQGRLAAWLPRAVRSGNNPGEIGASLTGVEEGGFTADFMYRAPDPAEWGDDEPQTFALNVDTIDGETTAVRWTLQIDAPNDVLRIFATDIIAGSLITFQTTDLGNLLDGRPHSLRLLVVEASGDDSDMFAYVDGELATSLVVDIGTGTTPPVQRVVLQWVPPGAPNLLPADFGQLAVWGPSPAGFALPSLSETTSAYFGHREETAGRRIERLCSEEDVSFAAIGDLDDTARMGPQHPDALIALLRECGDTDMGILDDQRFAVGIGYRTRESLHNQTATLALDYAAGEVAPPLDPVLDDQATRNDVTVTDRAGASARAVAESGPMSVESPPDGVGRVKGSVEANVAAALDLPDQAGWRLHLGTVPDIRWPQVTVDLDANPGLVTAVESTTTGSRITIDGLPARITPDLADLMVQGWTERIGTHRRLVTFVTTPYRPWNSGEWQTEAAEPDPGEPARYDTAGCVVADPLSVGPYDLGTDTTIYVITSTGPEWTTDTDDMPFDLNIAGARVRVTAVAAASFGTQELTIEAPTINGVSKTVDTGEDVRLWAPAYWAL